MTITVIHDLEDAAFKYMENSIRGKSIKEIINSSKHYRHPDSATISYAKIVENPIGKISSNRALRIGIVGAGASGICALYELSKIATRNNPITVTLYESDKNSFLFTSHILTGNGGGRVGRVSAATIIKGSRVKTVYEVGAMRFPETAGLTWHYAGEVFGSDRSVELFPNPGVVATEFVFGDRVDRYKGNTWADPNSPTLKVKELIIEKLWKSKMYKIGDRSPQEVSNLLKDANTSTHILRSIRSEWKIFAEKYEGTTLGSVIREIISRSINNLPRVNGLISSSERVNYYVEIFGHFGFGTGGFKPVFNASIVEFMRLLLWNYSAEYSFPAIENTDLIRKLFTEARKSPFIDITAKNAKVCDVFHRSERRSAGVAYYENGVDVPKIEHHDYVILAIPHIPAIKIISRFGSATRAIRNAQVGNPSIGIRPTGYDILPPLILSTKQGEEAVNAQIIAAIDNMHMTRSAKVFATISKKDANRAPMFHGERIQAVLSDCGLASSYMVPSPSDEKYNSFLVSYTWEDDTSKQQHDFHHNLENENSGSSAVFKRMTDRSHRWIRDGDEYKLWWFKDLLDRVEKEGKFFFDWTTSDFSGGFKLDMAGDHYRSDLCFRYHTHATSSKLGNRFFLASCSYTHLGGWLEGAFMSAINAVSGIVVAVNKGRTDALNVEARKLFSDLDSVIPPISPWESYKKNSGKNFKE